MITNSEFALNKPKLKDVVLYISSACKREELGNVKLHKILYFADMLHFLSTGKPLTGVEYQKQQFGPVARHLTWAVNELCREGRLVVERRDYYGYQKLDYKALEVPTSDQLTNREIDLLNEVIDAVCARSAREISELSHKRPWEAAEMGGTIPYYSAYGLLPTQISDEDIDDSIQEAQRIRPEVERELDESGVF